MQSATRRTLANLGPAGKKEQEIEFWKQLGLQLEIQKVVLEKDETSLDVKYKTVNNLFQNLLEMLQALSRSIRLDENIFMSQVQCESPHLLLSGQPEDLTATKTNTANE